MEDRGLRTSAGEQPVNEWARSEMKDLADATRHRVQDAKGEAKNYTAEAKDYVEGAREYLGDAVQQARDKVTELRDGGMDKVRHDVVVYTREQPMTALLIAAGAGLVLGWLSAGRR